MKRVLILSNHHAYTYNFRKEIIEKLIEDNYKVYVVLPYGKKVDRLIEMGCEFIDLPLDRRGMNPLKDFQLLWRYFEIIKTIKPNAVLSYTVKPNIYGGISCRILNVPFFPNVTGLGSAVENKSLLQNMLVNMYRIAYKKATCVFFQNKENAEFFKRRNININNFKIIPGSGVNTNHFTLLPYPNDDTVEFVYISRIMKEKGIDQFLEAASVIKEKYPKTKFHVLGFCEESYEQILKEYEDKKIITYHGMQSDIREFLKITHCTIHPTYYPEGMSNVLLESAASGRPIITTNRSGCREVVDNEINGYLIEQQNSKDLIEKIEKFLALSYTQKTQMGLAGRIKIEREFDRKIVVSNYMNELNKVRF